MARVITFENGLKLTIRGKIVGLLLQDMDLMVKIAMVIEREVDDAQSIRNVSVKDKMRESHPSSSSLGKKQKDSTQQRFQGQGYGYQGQSQGQLSQDGRHFKAISQLG